MREVEQITDGGCPIEQTLDGEGRLAIDLRCRSCRYRLLGTRLEDRCPECGRPVVASCRDALALRLDERQARQVSVGLKLVSLGFLLLAIGPLITTAINLVLTPRVAPSALQAVHHPAQVISRLILIVLLCHGINLMTSKAVRPTEGAGVWLAARWIVLLVIPAGILPRLWLWFRPELMFTPMMALFAFKVLLDWLAFVLVGVVMHRLARSLPSDAFEGRTRYVYQALVAVAALAMGWQLVAIVGMRLVGPSVFGVLGYVGWGLSFLASIALAAAGVVAWMLSVDSFSRLVPAARGRASLAVAAPEPKLDREHPAVG